MIQGSLSFDECSVLSIDFSICTKLKTHDLGRGSEPLAEYDYLLQLLLLGKSVKLDIGLEIQHE